MTVIYEQAVPNNRQTLMEALAAITASYTKAERIRCYEYSVGRGGAAPAIR